MTLTVVRTVSLTIPKIIRTVRHKGLLSIIAAAMKKVSPYRIDETIVFLRFDTQRQQVRPCKGLNATTIEPLENSTGEYFDALCAQFQDRSFRSRLASKEQQCFVAVTDGLVSGYAWVTTRACRVDELNWTLTLNDEETYIYDCFVLPRYRRRGIYAAMLTTVLHESGANREYPNRYVCIGSSPGNAASMSVIKAVGFTEYFRVRYRRFRRTENWLMKRADS